MALVPNKKDVNHDAEVERMHKMAKGPDGREKINSEFGIDLSAGGDLPRKGSGQAKKEEEKEEPKSKKDKA